MEGGEGDDFSDFSEEIYYDGDEYGEEEEVIEISENELLHYLEQTENPLVVCSKLFLPFDESATHFSILNHSAATHFQTHGFATIDNVIDAAKIELIYKNCMQRVEEQKLVIANIPTEEDPYRDPTARGDMIEFLKECDFQQQPALRPLCEFFQLLEDDLKHIVQLNLDYHANNCLIERQLAYYPPSVDARYHRHRFVIIIIYYSSC